MEHYIIIKLKIILFALLLTSANLTHGISNNYSNPDSLQKLYSLQNNLNELAEIHFIKGMQFYHINEYDKALIEYNKSLDYAKEIGNLELIKKNLKSIADVYKTKTDFELAYSYIEKFNSLNDSIIKIETKKEIAKLHNQYETQKKENIIFKQQSDIKKLKLNHTRLIIIINVFIILIISSILYLILKNLTKTKRLLQKVKENNVEINRKNEIILDSLTYAETIQKNIIPSQTLFTNTFTDSFIIDKPKDIIGGDFLWIHEADNYKIFALIDCSGHGVPGAIMTIATDFLLNKIVLEEGHTSPTEILEKLEANFFKYFYKENKDRYGLNSIEIGLCYIDDKVIEFSGARRSIVKISNGIFESCKGNLYSIGRDRNNNKYITYKFPLLPGDCYYMYSDGITSQFGGAKYKQLGTNQFHNILKEFSSMPMKKQKEQIIDFYNTYRNESDQIDDILIIGFRVN
ncbi:PP2C family protein-serine/threonine phosphatase [Bacteroidota bacterium]